MLNPIKILFNNAMYIKGVDEIKVYGIELNTINYHIKKIYEDNELDEDSTIRNFRIVQKEGNRDVSREVAHYDFQMIIAVGFKVNNERAVQFRISRIIYERKNHLNVLT